MRKGIMAADGDGKVYLRIRNLTKMFGDFAALRDVSLDVYDGEFVCFLGPSGCGKTTLLRAIAGLDIQTSGTVEQDGRDISALPPSERDFGIVFQSYALFPNMTVGKNVSYGLENRKLPRDQIRARVKELLELVGLHDQGDKYPAQLSGGQQQRVALARAMATSPGLLLLDEPLSALDAKVRVHLRGEIKDLQRRVGVTTIMVTHDQEEALTMADRIVVMDQGSIEQVGTPQEIYGEPRTSFVADFIGTMNFVPGEVIADHTVQIGGTTLTCPTDGITPGHAVTVAIRPEDINAQDIDGDDGNLVETEIRHLEFLGSFYRAELGGPAFGGHDINADFSINLVRRKNLDVGSAITVRFPAEFIRLYPRD
ncbi:MAG: putative 2-aminoethylphosphonate ABC transporter ATP-binding protein [Hyphomicrobiales bacterium]|nr:putative 2-aminoethylphosphonate ABC transporter ATP-binding protein [Hyphomicrobiales bacterium]MCP5374054.1 putative 2-aminoethylphosphonate ABC transporter ATP-binding protein [Hyphomicrobiales bacterium]